MMFKGYIQMYGKKPTVPIKNKNNWLDFQTAQGMHEYGGILADDLIMIDIDEKEQAVILDKIIQNKAIKCHKLQTTRGTHFYFKNPGIKNNKIGCILPIGIKADIKVGSRNTVVPLKLDGIERALEQVEAPEPLPKWLEPIKNGLNFYLMGEGDGRNQSLFNYILTLQAALFTKPEIIETIEIINKYVLKQPLSKGELQTILRDESFKADSKRGINHDEFARYLIRTLRINKINGKLCVYQDGFYQDAPEVIEKIMLEEVPGIKRAARQEVLYTLELLAEEVQESPPTHLVLGNGLYNIKTKQLEEFRPEYVAKNKIKTSYNPAAYSEDVDQVLDRITCQNKELRTLLEEVVGYAIYRKNFLGKAFILTGQGANGKSTFLDMINHMIGNENISSLSIQELGKQFKTAELDGKLMNIGDDIPSKYIDDNSVFKKLVTGEPVTVERKGQNPYKLRNYAKLYFSTNEMPKINDSSYGLTRRLVIIPFNANFRRDGGNYDPFIINKLTTPEALQYLLKLAISGLERVLNNNEFTKVEAVEQEAKEYELANNPVLQFMEDSKIENESMADVFKAYQVWTLENGYDDRYMTKNKLSKVIRQHGYTAKRIYSKEKGVTITIFSKT